MKIQFEIVRNPDGSSEEEFFSKVKPGQNVPGYRQEVKMLIFQEKLKKFFIGVSAFAFVFFATHQLTASALVR